MTGDRTPVPNYAASFRPDNKVFVVLGGALMNQSIAHAAGGTNGQNWDIDDMNDIAQRAGRFAMHRTMLYQLVAALFAAE
jgi:hypothetical protein